MIDQQIGRYHIIQKIGEGGMGVVYHARDSELKREVAVKLLREDLSRDLQFVERFKREAQVLASLNHPHIAAIYGTEEWNGERCLVMELVEGTTLSDRIAGGALPLVEALSLATQIAKALDYAHERSVMHRDLKPSNIKITPEGSIKLLDFGLAKALAPFHTQKDADSCVTLTGTGPGTILGTAAYMSPEQARGDPVDKRTDIWAFGIVLFQMLAGQHPFGRETSSQTIAAILEAEPDWEKLPTKTPKGIRRLLVHCLEKEPKQRLRDIADANIEIADALEPSSAAGGESAASLRILGMLRIAAWSVALLAAIAVSIVVVLKLRPAPLGLRTHLSILLPVGQQLAGPPAISADGRVIAWTSRTDNGRPLLYVRSLSDSQANAINGSEDAHLPFFSPDAEWIAFFARGHLTKAAVSGGSVTVVADAPDPWGGTWGKDGSIIFTPSFSSGLVKVSANGGATTQLTKPDAAEGGYAHMYPQFLSPDGRHVIFSLWSPVPQRAGTALLSLNDLRWQLLLPEWSEVAYAVPGYLIVGDSGAGLRIAAVDSRRPVPARVGRSIVSEPIAFMRGQARSWFAASWNGTVVYAPADFTKTTLVWVEQDGRAQPVTAEQQDYWQPALSPDGQRVAVRIGGDLWLYDLQRSTRDRLTFAGYNVLPVWNPDGSRIIYSSNRDGDLDLYSQSASVSEEPRRLLKKDSAQLPCSISRDGTIAFIDIQTNTGRDLWTLSPTGQASPLVVTPFNETLCRFSPDGHFLAYASDESGRQEVYVQPYPGPGHKVAISANGGSYPVWARDGQKLFFRRGDAMMAVDVKTTDHLEVTQERELFTSTGLGFRGEFDVSLDGKRFLMVRRDAGSQPSQLDVVLNGLKESAAGPAP